MPNSLSTQFFRSLDWVVCKTAGITFNTVQYFNKKAAGQAAISSFSASKEEDVPAMLTALGKLWMAGTTVDWSGFYQNEKRQHVALLLIPLSKALLD